VAALVCVMHAQAKEYFVTVNLMPILATFQVDANHQKHKDQFMKYLANAGQK
jgi:hypothetical protein